MRITSFEGHQEPAKRLRCNCEDYKCATASIELMQDRERYIDEDVDDARGGCVLARSMRAAKERPCKYESGLSASFRQP